MNQPRLISGFACGLACAALLLGCSGSHLPPPGTPPAGTATSLSPMALPNVPPEQPAEPAARTVIVVSDLHFGLGKLSAADWDHYEDFRWSNEWSEFLARIDQEGGGATDLVLNGDAFELWQSRTGDCQSRDPERGCSGLEALQRVQRIIAAHAPDLQRLGQFAMSGSNRVVIVPGNHDAALLFPEVAAAVVQSTGAAPDRLSLSATGYWISRDRRIYADHGHQIGIDPNAYRNWPRPFREQGEKWYLTRPWGEQFMQSFYNAYEDRYPIIDNVSAESEAVKFALAREGQSGLLHAVGRFVGFTLLKTSWTQRIDLARLQSPSSPPEGQDKGRTLTAEELAKDPKSREQIFGGYLNRVLDGMRGQQLASSPFDLYVFSHTHNLDVGFEIPSQSRSGTTRIVNSGAWQRVVSSEWLKREQTRRQIPLRDVLVTVALEDLPPCYGVVRIRPYAPSERPQAEVLYFRAASSPSGVTASNLSPTCE